MDQRYKQKERRWRREAEGKYVSSGKKKITGEFLYSFSGERFLVVIQGFLAVTQNPDIIEDR